MKKYQDKNVYEAAKERIKFVFENFEKVYVSFSGGKDSSVVLNLALDYMREHREKRKLGILFLDLEGQYSATINFIREILLDNAEYLDVYWVCLPLNLRNSVSVFQPFWTCWDIDNRDKWVREYPDFPGVITEKNNPFPFFRKQMEFEEFVPEFGKWYSNGKKTACLVGIRSDESLNRYRTIKNRIKGKMCGKNWTTKISGEFYNVYPIYDWKTTDVWTANGKFKWDYNKLYDYYYWAGVNLERQRVASPFIGEAQESLALYRAIDPNTWGKMIGRVNGVNFTSMYGGTHAMGWQSIKLPEGYTWREFMYFLLSTLPDRARNGYLRKLQVSVQFWRNKGGCLSDETIRRLNEAKVPIIVMDNSNYKTTKKPVRMEYQDDIDIPEFREIPTYKRMCICILKNDHACKYMGFSPTKEEMSKRNQVIEQYKNILQ